ncbi:MAG: glyoxalase [Calditrichaeota bacterium]|nr:MAG: glyoxalase [Calditrichota bacterium]MBL1207004.1 glyoxalase [Calditrichota bacterium]NOG46831.1 glyoxalase [Calditrichota bacterium]
MSENMNFATIIPTMRYNDASSAIEWLCKVFGFKKHLVVPGDEGKIIHAQLTFGNGMIMLGSAAEDEYGALVQPPANESSPCTQSSYIIVDDIDALYEKTKSAGGKIEIQLKEEDYGGKVFSCRDPQGQLWNFGSYNPWLDDQ